MAIKVAINGFGRIGRLAFREMFDDADFDIVAINNLGNAEDLAYVLKYDSAQGPWKTDSISVEGDKLVVDGKEVLVCADRDPKNLPWEELDVDLVLECTGAFRSAEAAQAHIDAGAKKVLISAPGSGDLKTIVYGVNHEELDGTELVASAASCTTNCLAPMANALHNEFGIKHGMMTTIHAYTNDQNTLDGTHPGGDQRRGRAAAANIVPNTTGAAKAIGLVIPELAGKLDGAAQRVPVITGSVVELFSVLDKKVTEEEINEVMAKYANDAYGYNVDNIVSSDIIGSKFGSIFDATQTKVMEVNGEQLVKTVAWYDNEMSFTANMVKTAKHWANA
ncbi:MAG: type I glyceraldehyde-3-phosphate dehydrogenase [Erysipelothrix sp.]|nr:type I glyceraldehyde-3-phosphate dehydrogenase [Erysipelothrix sp.]